MSKCYSRNDEEYNFESLHEVLQEMDEDGDLREGAVYWEADSRRPEPAEFFDAERVIEEAAERAYEVGGDYAEDFGDVSREAIAELQSLLKQWADKHCTVSFWTVHGTKQMHVTAEMVAEYMADAQPTQEQP